MFNPDTYFIDIQNDYLGKAQELILKLNSSVLSLDANNASQLSLSEISFMCKVLGEGAASVGFSDISKVCAVLDDLTLQTRLNIESFNKDVKVIYLNAAKGLEKRILGLLNNDFSIWSIDDLLKSINSEILNIKGNFVKKTDDGLDVFEGETSQIAKDKTSTENFKQLTAEDAQVFSPKSLKSKGKKSNSSIKVDTGKIDTVLDIVGEVVVLKNQLVHDERLRSDTDDRVASIIDQLDKTVRDLYERTLSIRMTPLSYLFQKLQRIARDVSVSLNKKVEVSVSGENTEVDRIVFELLNEPLVHIVRNAVDHGIESIDERREKKKSDAGHLHISAKQTGGQVIIEVKEDGAGINKERVLKKAIEVGIVPNTSDTHSISDEEIYKLIFHPGFSTAEKLTDISGRGVGLDVVRSNIEKIGGKIDVKSKAGLGTTFRMTIPLTTAITDGILVLMSGVRYLLPINTIREFVRVENSDFTSLNQTERVVKIRGKLLPVIDVNEILKNNNFNMPGVEITHEKSESNLLMIVESVNGWLAMPIEEVIGQAQVVVKPLTMGFNNISEISGAAILGDGRTVLVVDPNAFTNFAASEDNMLEVAA